MRAWPYDVTYARARDVAIAIDPSKVNRQTRIDIGWLVYCVYMCEHARVQVLSARFSPDQLHLALQTSTAQIAFINAHNGAIMTLSAKAARSNGIIMGFAWSSPQDAFLVTSTGLEIYHFAPFKLRLTVRLSKSVPLAVAWFSYSDAVRRQAATLARLQQHPPRRGS